MAVRPIDGNELLGIERLLDTDVVRQSKTASWLLDQVLHDIQTMPTLTPPNEPRMINADKLAKRIAGHSNYHGDSILAAIYCAAEGKENDVPIRPIETPPNEPLTCGLVDRHGMPLRAGDTVAADKFFVYAVRYGSHNVNPDNCAPAYQVGWYLEIMWAYPGFEDSVGHTEPLYDIDGTAARYPAHCADTADGLYNLKLEVCCRPPEGEADGK